MLRHKPESEQGWFYRASERVFNGIIAFYGMTLRWVLRHRIATLVVAIATTVDTDASVGGSWSTGDHAHTRCARGLGVGFRHEARPTFVAVGDELDLLGVPQTVQDGREAFAWDIEHVAYALVAQTIHNSVAAIHPACFGCGWHCFPH
jgi:hypothetical protein